MDLKILRKEMKEKRLELDSDKYSHYNLLINNKIINSKIYDSSKVVYCYCSVNNEVDLTDTIKDCLKKGKIVALPKVDKDTMDFYVISDLNDVEEGYFGIKEPVSKIVAPKADLIIVPGLAFTKAGKRIGYGGGFYDNYLENSSSYTIGVGFDFQIFEDLKQHAKDVKLDEVITN